MFYMTFKKELTLLDPERLHSVTETMIAKSNVPDEISTMWDNVRNDNPALLSLYEHIVQYFEERNLTTQELKVAKLASAATLLALHEYAEVDALHQQFPDTPPA
jgi:hypothetical protein